MKKNTMATAIIAGLAGVVGIANISTAVNINPDGVGQVLLYPYYTVNGGNNTVLSIVNTTDQGKAVKVRFLEAMNSRETRDFNLYLSAFDVWTATIFLNGTTGPANLITDDTSCTVPGIERGIFQIPTLADGRRYLPFSTALFGSDQASLPAGASSGDARTRSGYAEIIEMGTIRNETGFGRLLTHVNNRPAGCDELERAWLATGTGGNSGIWFSPPPGEDVGGVDLTPPSGGLFGGAAIINVGEGTYYNYNAEAIDGFSATVLHTPPASVFPNLNSVNTPNANPISYVFDRGRLITSSWTPGTNRSVDAVSALFMREAVFNEYDVDPRLGSTTEWVVTFPTRRYYVTGPTTFRAPFATGWSGCEEFSSRIYNREEDFFAISLPSPAGGFTTLCREANVLWFQHEPNTAAASPITGEPAYRAIPTYQRIFDITQKTFLNGWLWLGFYDEERIDAGGQLAPLTRSPLVESDPGAQTNDPTADRFYGLPATGFWAYRVTSRRTDAGVQVLASYGGAYPHRASRACFKGDYDASGPCG